MNGGHLRVVVLLGSLWQRVQVDMDSRWLGTTLGSTSLYENIRILLLCGWERVCILSFGVCESWIVDAIVWV